MRISRIILRVSNLERAVDFWSSTVGLPVSFQTAEFAFLDAGGAQLMLNHLSDEMSPALTEVVFEVDDIRETYQAMRDRGIPFEVDLRPVTSDERRELLAAHFRDPDGNLASLTGWVTRG